MSPSPAGSPNRPPSTSRVSPPRHRTHQMPPSDPAPDPAAQPASRDCVRVAVRVRPLNARERAAAADSRHGWLVDATSITQAASGRPVASNTYAFDHVFQPPATNAHIFTSVASPVVASAVEGINAVIFAYGQTAAGKTHTMLGAPDDAGVTPRSIAAVFEHVARTPGRQFLLRATYIEIYNEVIRDLLVPANDNLKIHEDTINKRVFVDAKEVVVSSVDQVMQIIAAGEDVRAVGETNMNDRSSRSHTIFSLKIESRELTPLDAQRAARRRESAGTTDDEDGSVDDEADNGVAVRSSTLSLVDLAGSERASFTKAQGMRLVEGGHINKSLLTLGTVINKLSSGESRSLSHIPYRDSKLTRLLQPALGGNARTAILCAVTPAALHMDETLSTLKFASRAKKVTNSAKTNEFLDDRAKLRRAEKLIRALRAQLQDVGAAQPGTRVASAAASPHRVSGASPRRPPHARRRSSRASAGASPARDQAFQRKFDRMVEALQAAPPARAQGATPVRCAPPGASALSALHLMDPSGRKRRRIEAPAGREAGAGNDSEKADLRRRAFRAERRLRQEMTNIEYERQDMSAEVRHLVATAEEASQQRAAAERDADHATHLLACATAASMVDEVVSEAMATSQLRGELMQAQTRLSGMKAVQRECTETKTKLTSLQREYAEMSRREKRGIGPVLKQSKAAQAKLADAEGKLKAAKANARQLGTEKAALERELKERERKLRVIQAEVERHRSHHDKVQTRVNKEFKAKVEAAEAELRKTLEKTQSDAAQEREAARTRLASLDADMATLNTTLKEAAQEREAARARVGALEAEMADLNTALADEKTGSLQLKERLGDLEVREEFARGEVDRLQSELSAAEQDRVASQAKLEELLAQISQLQLDNESHAQQLAARDADLAASRTDVADLRTEVARVTDECKVIKAERDDVLARVAAHAAEVQALRAGVSSGEETAARLRDEIAELAGREETARVETGQLKHDLARAAHDAQAASNALSVQRGKIEDLESALQRAKADRAQLQSDVAAAREKEAEALAGLRRARSEVEDARAEAARSSAELVEVRTSGKQLLDNLRAEMAGLKDELAAAARTTEGLRDELSAESTCRVQAEDRTEETRRVLEQVRAESARHRATAQESESRATSATSQIGKLETAMAEQRELLAAAESKSRRCEQRTEELEARLTAKEQERAADIGKENVIHGRELQSVLKELRSRTVELERLTETIRTRDAKIFELEEKLRDMSQGRVRRLEDRLRRRDEVIDGLTKKVERQHAMLCGSGFEQRWAAVERVATVEAENDALAQQGRDLKARVQSLEEEQRGFWNETTRLRDMIKQRDAARLAAAVQRHERRLGELAGEKGADGAEALRDVSTRVNESAS